MGRNAHFTKDDFIHAALDLIAEKGHRGVTIAAIAKKTKAPIGSVYHRFASRKLLMAELWIYLIASFQKGFIEAVNTFNGPAIVQFTLDWCRNNPNKAQVMLLHRRTDFVDADWPDFIKDRADQLREELENGFQTFAQHTFGKVNQTTLNKTVFALSDLPLSAIRRFLENNMPIPKMMDRLVKQAINTVLVP